MKDVWVVFEAVAGALGKYLLMNFYTIAPLANRTKTDVSAISGVDILTILHGSLKFLLADAGGHGILEGKLDLFELALAEALLKRLEGELTLKAHGVLVCPVAMRWNSLEG